MTSSFFPAMFVLCGLLTACTEPTIPAEPVSQVCFESKCFEVELAKTPQERGTGLMNREFMAQNAGMLFLFEYDNIHSFWMKNTLIPLDIIWIDKDGKVVFINPNTEPCKTADCPLVTPTERSRYVLELNAGMAEKIGLAIGDTMDIKVK